MSGCASQTCPYRTGEPPVSDAPASDLLRRADRRRTCPGRWHDDPVTASCVRQAGARCQPSPREAPDHMLAVRQLEHTVLAGVPSRRCCTGCFCGFLVAKRPSRRRPLDQVSRAQEAGHPKSDDPPLTCGFSVGLTGLEPATPCPQPRAAVRGRPPPCCFRRSQGRDVRGRPPRSVLVRTVLLYRLLCGRHRGFADAGAGRGHRQDCPPPSRAIARTTADGLGRPRTCDIHTLVATSSGRSTPVS
jgi:hypothetical protein